MPRAKKQSAENVVREIRRKTRRKYSAEEKIRIVLEGLRGEQSVAELCRAPRHALRDLGRRTCDPLGITQQIVPGARSACS